VGAHPSELVTVHVTSGDGGGDWRASVDWKACQSIILEVLRDKLVPEQLRDMPLGKPNSVAHEVVSVNAALLCGVKTQNKFEE